MQCEKCGYEQVGSALWPDGACRNQECGLCPDYKPRPLLAATGERQQFIREHASRLDCAALSTREGVLTLDPRKSWELAKELWDMKPEDC